MRLLTFLRADRQLTKTFYSDGTSDPYPLVTNFSSFLVKYDNIEEFLEAIELASISGACLLKGKLTQELKDEPRAGKTDSSAPTDYLVIDYDSDAGFETFDELLGEIDPKLAATDYIFQHSASAGINKPVGLRGHAFFLLREPVSPHILKQWLKKINLASEKFKSRIKLSRNAMSLCYALDITVNQNDKLIYIAPPNLINVPSPIDQRFELRKRKHRTYKFDSSVSVEFNRQLEHTLIESLQDASGMAKRTPKYKVINDGEILTNPAVCAVTAVKDCDKFVRINLNGGDSFAYWYYKDHPNILYNFKGEPYVYLQDIAPEYYAQLQRAAQARTIRPFVFRDIKSDMYYGAEYNEESNELVACNIISRRTTLNEFMVQRGHPAPKVVPDWDIVFDPTSISPVNFAENKLNLFRPSRYMKSVFSLPNAAEVSSRGCRTILRILQHLCVDDPTFERFMDWLAFIVQFREKTQTAWIFSGTEGTGKGTLFHRILAPILGHDHCNMITQSQMDEPYNGFLHNNLLLFLDEGDIEDSREASKVLAKFRTIITDPIMPIRMMRANTFQAPSFTNLIIATNQYLPIRITASDRRYNIAPRQLKRIQFDEGEYENIEGELQNFTYYLWQRKIDKDSVRKPVMNEAKMELLELSKTIADEFFHRIMHGDLDFFAERLADSPTIIEPGYIAYAKVVRGWLETAGQTIDVSVDDLVVVYRFIGGNQSINAKRFGHSAARHGMRSVRRRIKGIQRMVYEVKFAAGDYSEWLNRNTPSNVVSIKK